MKRKWWTGKGEGVLPTASVEEDEGPALDEGPDCGGRRSGLHRRAAPLGHRPLSRDPDRDAIGPGVNVAVSVFAFTVVRIFGFLVPFATVDDRT